MKVTTKGRYALRLLADLAQQPEDEYISLSDFAQRQDISIKYLEIIIGILHKAGFVLSRRGKKGGYKLAKPAEEYTIGSVLKLTEGGLSPVTCIEHEINLCPRADKCVTLPLWQGLDQVIDAYLESVTIADLIKQEPKVL